MKLQTSASAIFVSLSLLAAAGQAVAAKAPCSVEARGYVIPMFGLKPDLRVTQIKLLQVVGARGAYKAVIRFENGRQKVVGGFVRTQPAKSGSPSYTEQSTRSIDAVKAVVQRYGVKEGPNALVLLSDRCS